MRTEELGAETIDRAVVDTIGQAAEHILNVLKEKTYTTRTVSSRDNVFYFDGWDGLGASAVLRAIAQRLATVSADGKRALAELGFDHLIHIDCSMWESRRALQRAVAEQLKLPSEVMEMFDREDEEDDFRGVAQGSRAEVQQVLKMMQRHIQKLDHRFLVIFHNGSSEEIDLASLYGFPLSGFSTNKVLWTFQGRFRLKPRTKVDTAMKTAGTTDVFLSVHPFPPSIPGYQFNDRTKHWSYLVRQEAAEVAMSMAHRMKTGPRGTADHPEQVEGCFRYMLASCFLGGRNDFPTHGANYWTCDGIIQQLQQEERGLSADVVDDWVWRAADALQREMPLDMDYQPSYHLSMCADSKPYWISPKYGFNWIPAEAISSGDMFQHYADKLSVLKLSGCTFDFQSPPFLCCHSLRFLWLGHCQGTRTSTDVAGKELEDVRRCFQRLWVLDVRHTDCDQILSAQMLALMTQLRELNVIGAKGWDMGQLQGRLPNIRKLRVKKSDVSCSCPEKDLFSEMNKMEHLDFSQSGPTMSLFGPGVSSNVSSLQTVFIVDGCRVKQISFSGSTELKSLLLGGPMRGVRTIDISGTAVKTLDLSTTEILDLDELYLLDCEKLCAILWPPEDYMREGGLDKLCIDTTQSAPTAQSTEEKAKWGTSTATAAIAHGNRPSRTLIAPAARSTAHGNRPSSEFDWHISVRDARLLASLKPIYSDSREAYVDISSPHPTIVGGDSKDEGVFKSASCHEQQLVVNLQRRPVPAVYTDISVDSLQQANEGGGDTLGIMWMCPCPDVPLSEKRCYLHIQDQIKTKLSGGGEETSTITVPRFVTQCAKILHVHDSLSITSITSDEEVYGSEWDNLEWCRIERCPKLDFVFNSVRVYGLIPRNRFFRYQLRIFWASQLLKSRYISTSNGYRSFPHVTLLHLDFCPRLIHVHPLSIWSSDSDDFCLLETLEITWCGDLKEIFPFNGTKDFPMLKHIHLHELPSLQRVCGTRMFAPNLETVEIRGCWSLTRLPDITSSNKVVQCDCEKEWWDRVEWDDRSHMDQYKPIHPRYYKKKLLRGAVLR